MKPKWRKDCSSKKWFHFWQTWLGNWIICHKYPIIWLQMEWGNDYLQIEDKS